MEIVLLSLQSWLMSECLKKKSPRMQWLLLTVKLVATLEATLKVIYASTIGAVHNSAKGACHTWLLFHPAGSEQFRTFYALPPLVLLNSERVPGDCTGPNRLGDSFPEDSALPHRLDLIRARSLARSMPMPLAKLDRRLTHPDQSLLPDSFETLLTLYHKAMCMPLYSM